MGFDDENPSLFHLRDASSILAAVQIAIERAVDRIPDDDFRRLSNERLLARIVNESRVEPLTLIAESRELTQNTAAAVGPDGQWMRLDDPFRPTEWHRGAHVTVTIRYEGLGNLWNIRPHPEWQVEARGKIEEETDRAGRLQISVAAGGKDWRHQIRMRIDECVLRVTQTLDAQRAVLEEWNSQLAASARVAIRARRTHMREIDDLPHFLEIPLAVREGRVDYRPVDIRKRDITPTVAESEVADDPEYRIGINGYEQILHVCRHFGRSFEASPRPLHHLKEPQIRDLHASALNMYFEGGASTERFRREGYTDVLIEEKERAAFIGEFKLWRGPAGLLEAIDQLLDYATWRDTKCAIVMFNRRVKDYGALRVSVPDILQEHRTFRRMNEVREAGEWRFVVGRQKRSKDEVLVHLFIFDVRSRGRRTPSKRGKEVSGKNDVALATKSRSRSRRP